MGNGDLIALTDRKKELTQLLCESIAPTLVKGVQAIYQKIIQSHSRNALKDFQAELKTIDQWSQLKVSEEMEKVREKCDYFDELLKATFSTFAMVLLGKTDFKGTENLNLRVPSPESFLHRCYLAFARDLYLRPYLISHQVRPVEQQQNLYEMLQLAKAAVKASLRSSLPLDKLLKAMAVSQVASALKSSPSPSPSSSDTESDPEEEEEESESESEPESESEEEEPESEPEPEAKIASDTEDEPEPEVESDEDLEADQVDDPEDLDEPPAVQMTPDPEPMPPQPDIVEMTVAHQESEQEEPEPEPESEAETEVDGPDVKHIVVEDIVRSRIDGTDVTKILSDRPSTPGAVSPPAPTKPLYTNLLLNRHELHPKLKKKLVIRKSMPKPDAFF